MDSVPIWVLLVCLGALGALVMFGLAVLRDHMSRDSKIHETVAVHDAEMKDIKDKNIPRIEDRLAEHDERLHHHGREIQSLIGKDYLRDKK